MGLFSKKPKQELTPEEEEARNENMRKNSNYLRIFASCCIFYIGADVIISVARGDYEGKHGWLLVLVSILFLVFAVYFIVTSGKALIKQHKAEVQKAKEIAAKEEAERREAEAKAAALAAAQAQEEYDYDEEEYDYDEDYDEYDDDEDDDLEDPEDFDDEYGADGGDWEEEDTDEDTDDIATGTLDADAGTEDDERDK